MKSLGSRKLILFIILSSLWGGRLFADPESVFDSAENHYKEGMKYLEKGELEKGKNEFEQSLKIDKKFAPAYEGIGNYYLQQGQLDEALKQFETSKKRDGSYAPAYIGIGKVYYLKGNSKKAKGYFKDATGKRRFYNSPEAFYYLGYCELKEEKFDDAREAFEKGLAWEPGDKMLTEAMANLNRVQTVLPGFASKIASDSAYRRFNESRSCGIGVKSYRAGQGS